MDCAKGPFPAPFLAPQEQDKLSLERPFGQSINANGHQCQWPKDRPTTLEKTDNARTGAFALNESRPGAMTKPWRRSWGKGRPSKNGGIVLVAVFHVKAMNRWGMLSERGKRRSVRPNLPQGEKTTSGSGAFRANRIHGEGRKEHGRCGAMIDSGRCRFRPPRAAMDFGWGEGGENQGAGGPATETRTFVDSRDPPPTH